MSKQRGAEMSSRLIPPYDGAIRAIASTSSSTVPVSMTTGTASMSAKCLKRTALPSMTGMAPRGPMSPRPSTAVPSLITATVLRRAVYRIDRVGSAAMARDTSATPGV